MERKSWPWRRKPSEKSISASHSTTLSPVITPKFSEDPPQRIFLEQEVPKVPTENATNMLEAVRQWQQAEEKVKNLTEKLADALADVASKDATVKQHAKVAEEAVSGWEKAEAETLALKEQLEASTQQKKVLEGRVSHLDGALKECMRQVRHVKDEQEEKIREAILRKNTEWDQIRAELEAKMSELGRQLLESGAENRAMSKSLQERARTIVEINEAKGKAEAAVKVLQVQLDSLEKEISALKYELHVQNKELEIRNEEREYSRKAGEAAHKQHLENVKKIAKLESECQRLRTLVRKKLPGPAALAQMRMEVEVLGREVGEGKRRRSQSKNMPSFTEPSTDNLHGVAVKEVEMLTDRLLSMEEETKLLKEALAKRNGELQTARQLCARTASKLSAVEEQLEVIYRGQGLRKAFNNSLEPSNDTRLFCVVSKEPSVASRSEDGDMDDEASCAESWASALIAELAHFKKDKKPGTRQSMESSSFDNVDEFSEMGRQDALTGNEAAQSIEATAEEEVKHEDLTFVQEVTKLWKDIASRESELRSASQTCKDVKSNLAMVEVQLSSLQSENLANEATLAQVQESQGRISEAHKEISKVDKVLSEVQITVASTDDTLMKLCTKKTEGNLGCGGAPATSEGFLLDGSVGACTSNANNRNHSREPTLIVTLKLVICLLVQLVEALVPVIEKKIRLTAGDSTNLTQTEQGLTKLESLFKVDLGRRTQNLIEKLMQGRANAREFLVHIASVISCLSGVSPSDLEIVIENLFSSNPMIERETLCVSDSLETEAATEVIERGEENLKVKGGEEKLDAHEDNLSEKPVSNLEPSHLLELQTDLERVKQEKEELERKLNSTQEDLLQTRRHLEDTESSLSALKADLAGVQILKERAEKDLANVVCLKTALESRLGNAEDELNQLREQLTSLAAELEEKQQQYQDAVNNCEDLKLQLNGLAKTSQGASNAKEHESMSSRRSADDDDEARLRKEREVAAAKEKLAECQRTILVLGKQLKALTSPHDSPEASFNSSVESATSIENKIIPRATIADLVFNSMEETHPSCDAPRAPSFSQIERRANSGRVWTRSDRRYDHEPYWNPPRGYISGSIDPEFYMAQHRTQNGVRYAGGHYGRQVDLYRGNGVHSPIHEYAEVTTYMCSPPDTALSSPTRSPARYPQFSRRGSGAAVQTNLTKSMNRVATASSVQPVKPSNTSSFSKLFSRSKYHR